MAAGEQSCAAGMLAWATRIPAVLVRMTQWSRRSQARIAGWWRCVKRVGEEIDRCGSEQIEGGDVADRVEDSGRGVRGVDGVHVRDAHAGIEQGRKRRMRTRHEQANHGSTGPGPGSG